MCVCVCVCVCVFVCMEYIFFMTGINPSVIASSVFKRRSSPYVLKRLKQYGSDPFTYYTKVFLYSMLSIILQHLQHLQ